MQSYNSSRSTAKRNIPSFFSKQLTSPFVLHPYFFVLYYSLTRIVAVQFRISVFEFAVSVLLLFLVNLSLLFIYFKTVRNIFKAGVLTTITLTLVTMFWALPGELERISTSINLHLISGYWVETMFFLLLFLFTLLIKRSFTGITKYLNIVMGILVMISLYYFFFNPEQKNQVKTILQKKDLSQQKISDVSKQPDVYFIILDAHTSSESLKRFWGYDDSSFVVPLEQAGFQSIQQSNAFMPATYNSLASTLNLSHDTLIKTLTPEECVPLIAESSVRTFFIKNGYQFINLSIFNFPGSPRFYYFPFSENRNNYMAFFSGSLPVFIYKHIMTMDIETKNLAILRHLQEVPQQRRDRPRFTYAHIMAPHSPYLFRRDGSLVPWIRRLIFKAGLDDKNAYLDNVVGINLFVKKAVMEIIRKSKVPPIIIIQGDHGFRVLKTVSPAEKEKEKSSLLNLVLLPKDAKTQHHDSIGPAETMSVIIDYLSGVKR